MASSRFLFPGPPIPPLFSSPAGNPETAELQPSRKGLKKKMALLQANDSLNGHENHFLPLHPTSIGSLVIFSITFLLGLPGNSLVIWVTALKMKRTVNTVWFLHLAVADLVCCLTLPFSIGHLALREHWPFGWFFCKVVPSVMIFNMFASIFLLTAISIDRCLVVMRPIWSQNHRTVSFASVICGGIWLLAFAMSTPSFYFRETVVTEFDKILCVNNWNAGDEEDHQNWSDDLFFLNDVFSTELPTLMDDIPPDVYSGDDSRTQPSKAFWSITISRSLLGFLLPLGIMATCYALVAWRVLKKPFAGPRQKALRVILLVVASFFLCWAPYHVTGMLFLSARPGTAFYETLVLWDSISIALAYANSCINPLLYVFVGQNFRAKARQSLLGVFEGAFAEAPPATSSHERSKTTIEDLDSPPL